MGIQGWEGFWYPDVRINSSRTLGQKINTKEEITSWMRWIHVGPTWQLLRSSEQCWFHDHDKNLPKTYKVVQEDQEVCYALLCVLSLAQGFPNHPKGTWAKHPNCRTWWHGKSSDRGRCSRCPGEWRAFKAACGRAQGSKLVGHLSNTHGISGCLGLVKLFFCFFLSTGKSNWQEMTRT